MRTYQQCEVCNGKGRIITLSRDNNKPDTIIRCNTCEGTGSIEREDKKSGFLSIFNL